MQSNHLAWGMAILGCSFVTLGQTPGQPGQPGQVKAPAAPTTYTFITGEERFKWFVDSTVGPTSMLAAGPISAAWGTMLNSPEEYGPHWEGFGKRYGMRLTGVSTGNAIEAVAGAALKEDPRYIRSPAGTSFGGRAKHIVIGSFMAQRPDGSARFSYSRVAGNVGNNFLSNLWRVESEATAKDATMRCVWGLTSRMASFAFQEFWPSVSKKLKRK